MTQWEQLQRLDPVNLHRVDELYSREEFPMDVRHYLATWIESQDWERASQDRSLASVLFQVLLENLDIQHSRFVQERESFLQQRNFRRFKQNFQKYQEQPDILARVISWFLLKEQDILKTAQLAEQVQMLQVQQSTMEMDSQRNIECRMSLLRNKVQGMEHSVKLLEEQQDEFDFKFQTRMMEGSVSPEGHVKQLAILQHLLNNLNSARKSLISDIVTVLTLAEDLVTVLVKVEVPEWQRRQQRSCIGAREDTDLVHLENWFSAVADFLFHVRKFLKKMEELHGKVTYDNDPFKERKPALQSKVDELLTELLRSAFVVETQPSMPQGKGPLVLRTSVQFSVKTQLLVKIPELNHVMKVTVSVDRDAPQVKGYRRFNVLGTHSKALNMVESNNGGMVADFRHLTLKEQKTGGGGGKGANDVSLSVTEELHVICFDTTFELHGLSVALKASSLPVLIISNSSQQQAAWASILWFNTLCSDPLNIGFFANPPLATWLQLADTLSCQFLSATECGLDADQLDMIALKLFGKQQNYNDCRVSWTKFSKESMKGAGFSFYVWFDGILVLVKNYLENIWKDGCIMGFVSKEKEKSLLSTMETGTFLLRFSESIRDGGITFSWVEHFLDGTPNVRSVQPFTKVDLSQIPFSDIICNFQLMEADNVPENPLKTLYPDIPRDQAFGKYCEVKSAGENPYIKYMKTKLVFVSKENTLEAKTPLGVMDDVEGEPPVNGLCGEDTTAFSETLFSSAMLNCDPLGLDESIDDAGLLETPEDLQRTLQEFLLSDTMMSSATDFSPLEDPAFQLHSHAVESPLYS